MCVHVKREQRLAHTHAVDVKKMYAKKNICMKQINAIKVASEGSCRNSLTRSAVKVQREYGDQFGAVGLSLREHGVV